MPDQKKTAEQIRAEQRAAIARRNAKAKKKDAFKVADEQAARARDAANDTYEAVDAREANKDRRNFRPAGQGSPAEGSAFRDYRGIDGAVDDAVYGKKKDKKYK